MIAAIYAHEYRPARRRGREVNDASSRERPRVRYREGLDRR